MDRYQSKVAIVKSGNRPTERKLAACVRKAVGLCGGLSDIVRRNDTVLIKPNLVAARPVASGAITDPRICKALADMVAELGATPVIAESAAVGEDTERAFQVGGYNRLRKAGYEVIDLKRKGIKTVDVPIPAGKSMKEVTLPRIVVDADVIISVPKMKTHDAALVTLSLKNMKGVVPDNFKRRIHQVFGLFQGVVDLCSVVKPDLVVMDAIIAMEGLVPVFGDPVKMNLVLAGKDPVAVDAVASAVMGFEPYKDQIIRIAEQSGLGTADLRYIEVIGESIAGVKRSFKTRFEVLSERVNIPEGTRFIQDDKACTGCKNAVYSLLMNLEKEGRLNGLRGWTIAAGQLDKLPDNSRGKILLVGACLTKYRDKGVFIPGCPPYLRDFREFIDREFPVNRNF